MDRALLTCSLYILVALTVLYLCTALRIICGVNLDPAAWVVASALGLMGLKSGASTVLKVAR